MKNKQLFTLHFAYWTGILMDAGAAVLLMFPSLGAQFFHWSSYEPSAGLGSIAGFAASLMWGWTFLLFWADRKPFERRGVLLLTVFPVVMGIMVTRVLDTWSGLVQWFPGGLVQPILILLFLFAYFYGKEPGFKLQK